MAYTDINSEDRLVQATFAEHLKMRLAERVSIFEITRPLGQMACWV
jgi:hypothetical protein